MRHKAAVAVTLALAAAAGQNALLAQGRGGAGERSALEAPAPTGQASVAGRVLDGRTLAPVRAAEVVAISLAGARVAATTDDEGRYLLNRLTPGPWRITASKGGYFTWQLGQRRPFEKPAPIALARSQQLTADIPLSRGGAISGRVYDEFGEAIAGLHVRVYRTRMVKGYRRVEAVGAADLTDDNGAFRVWGLPPGDYYVAASLRVAPVDSIVETTYAPTYFPGTGNLAEAQRIKLALGAEASAVFSLLPVRRVRVSGLVLTSSGAPGNAFLDLESDATELGVPIGTGGVTRSDGTFTIPDVPPGRYTLSAALRGDGPDESSALLPVTVYDDDLEGITLVTGSTATLRGTFAADAGVSRRLPDDLSVTAIAARGAGANTLSSASGTPFELGSLGEPFQLLVEGLPEDWAVKEILVNGLSVIDGPVELGRGEKAEARIMLTDRVTEVAGVVDGPAAGEASVVVFPEESTLWGVRSRYVRLARTDSRGQFRITGLPPGQRYLAIAADYLEEGEHTDPEFLESMRGLAVPFALEEHGKLAVGLRIIER